MTKIRITQVRSKIGSSQRQKKTLEALGIKKISNSIETQATPQILGMVEKVRHLLEIKDIK